MAFQIEPQGRFGVALADALAQNDMNLNDLATKLGITYEHTRKLIKGEAFPSRPLMRELVRTLKMDMANTEKLVTQGKMEHKYGKLAHSAFGHDPRLAPYQELVPFLTPEQNDMFVTQMRAVLRQNRKKA